MDQPNGEWLDSGLPVVGYFHDQELALQGVGWFTRYLDAWQEAGFRRFIDFRELAAALSLQLDVCEPDGGLTVAC
ncbi:MAG TPA: hypothetical protein VMM76_07345 [Pirellulaceae bacterium]|nr:hypothetical protein [Pirellulaceae bacterium]